jgi:tetratricopeptide (TPR) repeat protein
LEENMRRASPWLLILLLALVPTPGRAASEVGEVAFANSGAAAAQQPFLSGLALLHNFEYEDAAEQFQKAEAIDPAFAMAYWGEAMTHNHPVWMQQEPDAARAVLLRLGATPEARLAKAPTARERDYLRAVEILYGPGGKEERDFRYSAAMAALHARFPDDVDATAFYALSLLGTAHQGRDFALYMRSAALLEEVLPTHPRHPGVLHYLIHSYDDPVHAPLGLRAARVYGSVAPNAGHALHMTSHIFVALGWWDDVIAANERAIRVVDHHRAEHGQGAKTCGHYVGWLDYAYLQERRFDAARQQLDACRRMTLEIVNHPPLPTDGSFLDDYAEMRVFHAIESGHWDAADPFTVPAGPYAGTRLTLAYGEAMVAAAAAKATSGSGLAAFQAAAARLHDRHQALLKEIATQASDPAARTRAGLLVAQVDALLEIRAGKQEEGIARLRKAAEEESAMAFEFGPPAIEKPTWELLGDELQTLGRNAEAETAYQAALARAPGRTSSLQGRLRAEQALGKTGAAELTKAQLQRYVRSAAAARWTADPNADVK